MRIIIIATALYVLCVTGYAAPSTLSKTMQGNTSDIVSVTRPEQHRIVTFDQYYCVAGYAVPNTEISFYILSDDLYVQLLDEKQQPISLTVGASGLFWKELELSFAANNILIYAVNNDTQAERKIQAEKVEVSLLRPNIYKQITNIKIDPKINY